MATFSYSAWAAIIDVLPSDHFPHGSVATVSGMSGMGCSEQLSLRCPIGYVSDRYSFGPLLMAASVLPLIATGLALVVVPNSAFDLPAPVSGV